MTIETRLDVNGFMKTLDFLSKNFDDISLNVDLKYLQKCLESEVSGLLVHDEKTIITLSINICNSLVSVHPDYSTLASRVCAHDLHKHTNSKFSGYIKDVYTHKHSVTGKVYSLLSDDFYKCVCSNAEQIDSWINDRRDFEYS